MRVLWAMVLIAGGALVYKTRLGEFRFIILGDRTGEAVPGVYEEAWKEASQDRPDFLVSVGDTIEGGNDRTVVAEWQQITRIFAVYRRFRIFLTPGNHDVWSVASANAYQKYARHPLHYGFDYGQAHFTILDNSRSDKMPSEELAFLEKDLRLHAGQSVKFVFSHRPSWILQVLLKNPDFEINQLAKRYGVKYVIAGHLHEMLHFELDGVTYLSIGSSGGHLRATKRYEDGWFFQRTLVTVHGGSADFLIKELAAPFGHSRVTTLADWGGTGLSKK